MADDAAYAYLLGYYLGDGHLVHKPPNGWTLRVACDRIYPGVEAEVKAAMSANFPDATPRSRPYSHGAANVVSLWHPALARAFPQHGTGLKHQRAIVLEDWQLAITRADPAALVRGLVHSDGCRTVNAFETKLPSGRVGRYSYIRYFFSNLSPDIRAIFAEHCRLLGVRVTQPNHRNLAVSHRDSVAILERLIGPKT